MEPLSILVLSGSPSPNSKTAMVAEQAGEMLLEQRTDIALTHVRASDLVPTAVLTADFANPGLKRLAALLDAAHGVIVATPIFKASFSGLLKAVLDVMPQFGLAGKVVLPIGTGGSLAHVLALDYSMRPVLQSMGARHIVQAHFAWENDLVRDGGHFRLTPEGREPLHHAIRNFAHSLTAAEDVRWLGHPRPVQLA